MSEREFQYSDDKSHKFWRICLDGPSYVVQFGRIGTTGQTQTKSFAAEVEAQHACERLIQEKLEKGYVEVNAVLTTVASSAPSPVQSQSSGTAAPLPQSSSAVADRRLRAAAAALSDAGTTPATGSTADMGEPIRSINLDPRDWQWATWRPWTPLPKPEPLPFDRDAALARLSRIPARTYGCWWNWGKAIQSPSLSREAAHFWFSAITRAQLGSLSPAKLSRALAEQDCSDDLPLAEADRVLRTVGIIPPEMTLCLAHLYSLADLVDCLLALRMENSIQLVYGFRFYVLPYLTKSETQAVRERVRRELEETRWPSSWQSAPTSWQSAPKPAFHLAACLGFPDEMHALVDSWPDDLYADDTWSYDYWQRPQEIVFGLGDPTRVDAEMRRLKLRLRLPHHIRAWLAHTEYGALDWICDSILACPRRSISGDALVLAANNRELAEKLVDAFALVNAPEAAPHMLELMLSSPACSQARRWLYANPVHTIAGLAPVPAGRGRLADAAVELLQSLKRCGHQELIRTALARQQVEVAEPVRRRLLELDEAQPPPFGREETPDWLRAAMAGIKPGRATPPPGGTLVTELPPVIMEDRCLNDEQITAVLTALQGSSLAQPHPLVAALQRRADRTALDRFAWKLLELWLTAGARPKESWALFSVGLLGGDEAVLKLAPLIREWPAEGRNAQAILALDCLQAIGTDTALMQIGNITQTIRFKGARFKKLKARADECIEAIAVARGLSRAELEDRMVPDCGLDERGSRTFEFGSRKFQLVLGPEMQPMLCEETGSLRSDLPKPGAKDDPDKARQAAADWKLLKKQVAEVARIQSTRLEQAMVMGRRWTPGEFETLLARHPLMTSLARRLVWGAYDERGRLAATFRVTEDQTYADVQDKMFTLEPYLQVGITHPLHLDEEEHAAWGELLSDYEVFPPFPQLSRKVHRLEPREIGQTEITRCEALELPAQTLIGILERLGWAHGPVEWDAVSEYIKPFPAARVTAILQYKSARSTNYMGDLELKHCFFIPGTDGLMIDPQCRRKVPLGDVDLAAVSEVLSLLSVLASRVS
jgi:predicted DNA-binding WGR domain protein